MSVTKRPFDPASTPAEISAGQAAGLPERSGAGASLDRMSREIRAGLDADEFHVALQPILEVRTGRLWGHEALARWDRGSRLPLGPDRFLPVAEATGLIHDLGPVLLAQACRAALPTGLRLAVNLSPVQLDDPLLPDRIAAILDATGFPATRLELELTESRPIDAPGGLAVASLVALRDRGIRISLDDFGMGHASISHLRTLPFDKLKIDRAYVADLLGEKAFHARAVLEAIVALARAYGLEVAAEGVETEAQAEALRTAGCDYLQGYLVGRPERLR